MVTPADEQPETMTVDEFLAGARARLDRVLARVSNPGRGGSGNGPETDSR
ncbi:MAG: hypothetical protein VX194_06335 [Actinomycetota bacterium]|nr:hypothetical protein [Actinomycetota bacterium]MEC8686941.1 hypothetical protein [Actinomycetota bacterium]